MRLMSLKARLFSTVAAIVVCCSLVVATVVSHRYSEGLQEELLTSTQKMLRNTAIEAADQILVNDLVSLQKHLDIEKDTHTSVGYVFVHKGGEVLAHTFEDGVPKGLLSLRDNGQLGPIQVVGEKPGEERFVDFVMPILDGKVGFLRLGVTTEGYTALQQSLIIQVAGLTLLVMLIALAVSNYLITAITRPLSNLAVQARELDETGLDKEISVAGYREVENLAVAFNGMLERMRTYTERLKGKNLELQRAQSQTLNSLTMAREVASMTSFSDIGAFLITHMKDIVSCRSIQIALLEPTHQNYMFMTNGNQVALFGKSEAEQLSRGLEGRDNIFFSQPGTNFSFFEGDFVEAKRLAVAPIRLGGQAVGAMFIACPGSCNCVERDLKIIELILAQAVGPLWRAASQEGEFSSIKGSLDKGQLFEGMVGKAPVIQSVFKLVDDVAPSDASVLVTGESGTGKEMVANALHALSPRAKEPFVVINCSAYPATLLESELFGHEKGAFTGAISRKKGRFELADGGTVFLDEIGEISPSAQVKLLRVLQTKVFERIGGNTSIKVNVRVVAATNRDLLEEVESGSFREDLFYRLNVIPIVMPPLRDRRNDTPLLARFFLARFREQGITRATDFSTDVLKLFLESSWPGNVRELENTIEHAAVLTKGAQIEVEALPQSMFARLEKKPRRSVSLESSEKVALKEALAASGGNKKKAAELLGISRSSLYNKLKKYGV